MIVGVVVVVVLLVVVVDNIKLWLHSLYLFSLVHYICMCFVVYSRATVQSMYNRKWNYWQTSSWFLASTHKHLVWRCSMSGNR